MDITISLTKAELKAGWGALDSMSDNEHDQGADDGTLATSLASAIDCVHGLYEARTHDQSERTTLPLIYLAIMVEAVEIFCTDPADDESEDAPTERAFALRLRDLPTINA